MCLEGVCNGNMVLLLPGQAGREGFNDFLCVCITVSQPILYVGCLVRWVLVSCGTHSTAQEAWVLMSTVYAQLGSCGREV